MQHVDARPCRLNEAASAHWHVLEVYHASSSLQPSIRTLLTVRTAATVAVNSRDCGAAARILKQEEEEQEDTFPRIH